MDIPGENIRIPQPIRIVPPIPFLELKQRVYTDIEASRIKVYLFGSHSEKWGDMEEGHLANKARSCFTVTISSMYIKFI